MAQIGGADPQLTLSGGRDACSDELLIRVVNKRDMVVLALA